MHLNIEKLSFISFLGTALEMKGKRVERPVLVKRSQNAGICIPLIRLPFPPHCVQCSAVLWVKQPQYQ